MHFNRENILGYQIAAVNKDQCLEEILSWIVEGRRQHYVVCANPHSLEIAEYDPVFCSAIREANLIVPDGVGILMASRILGRNIHERVTGSDIFLGICKALNEVGNASCFFLGSTEETLAKLKKRMQTDFPNVTIVGSCSPSFRHEFSDEETLAMIAAVNWATPDVLWVGMTAPKQEKWIHQNKDKLNVKFIGAVGAVFDFYAGNVKRSRPWFLEHGLEWLPRLLQEPRRLWRRTLISAPLFFLRVLRQRVTGKV
jgi:N-acetylglucosaminyldiphosphoundecaprenol N-acetyl-beta-D-mannosaminyltransferase